MCHLMKNGEIVRLVIRIRGLGFMLTALSLLRRNSWSTDPITIINN